MPRTSTGTEGDAAQARLSSATKAMGEQEYRRQSRDAVEVPKGSGQLAGSYRRFPG